MAKSSELYQLKEVLAEVRKGSANQALIMTEMKNAILDIGKTMQSFSKISDEQIRQKVVIKNLEDQNKEFKEFIKNRLCQSHESEIEILKESDSSKSNITGMAIIGAITALITGFVTWLATHTR